MTGLVERVARSIAETEDNPIPYATAWMDEARAAIRIVLEEAAKTADACKNQNGMSSYSQGRGDAATEIAADIRDMIPKDGE